MIQCRGAREIWAERGRRGAVNPRLILALLLLQALWTGADYRPTASTWELAVASAIMGSTISCLIALAAGSGRASGSVGSYKGPTRALSNQPTIRSRY